MSLQHEWLVENKILLFILPAYVDGEAIKQMEAVKEPVLSTAENEIHLIIDATQVKDFDRRVLRITTLIKTFRAAQLGWIVVIGGIPGYTHSAMSMLSSLFGLRYKLVDDLASAKAFLQDQIANV